MSSQKNRLSGFGGDSTPRHGQGLLVVAALGCVLTSTGFAQRNDIAAADLPSAPSSVMRLDQAGVGNVSVDHATPDALSLSIDDAISLALKGNTNLTVARLQEKYVAGQVLTVENSLLPTLQVSGYTKAQEINLAALGFKPSLLAGDPAFASITIPQIVKVNTTDAQISLSQTLFNVPAYYLYKSAKKATEAASWNTLNERGDVVLTVGTDYLRALADQAQIANAKALVKQDQDVLRHAQDEDAAGVGIHIDVLRAQVELQQEQQALIADQNTFEKDKIALNRAMGIAADQQLTLMDAVPFSEFAELSIDDALALAYTRRKDLLGLMAQQEVAIQAQKAVKFQYLPTVGVAGYYGVLGQTTGSYHGVFQAGGSLRFPIFDEGQLRGQREVAAAQTIALKHQIDALKSTVEAQIRSSMLDVESSAELVKVARSNVALSQEALDDATLRFTAGVDDSLPVTRAQATLVGAQAQVVQTEFQYNQAKLELARRTGVVETQYKQYLGK